MIACCLFDLDGVIVDTARYHYLAWASLARELGFEFTPEAGEATKGVSRMASLEILLRRVPEEKREPLREVLEQDPRPSYQDNPERVYGFGFAGMEVRFRASNGVLTVLGSASKNAGTILDRCGLRPLFDAVVDGTGVTHPKPDPEVFAKGAGAVGARPENCVVFEDAAAGIEAAARAGMRSVGVGGSPLLAGASMQLKGFEGFTFEMLCREID